MLSIILFLIIAITLFSLAQGPIHNFKGMCSSCHLTEGEKVFETIFINKIDFQCKRCHDNLGLSHPTGMKPAMKMPEGFPLDPGGRVTCATCHKIHGKDPKLLNSGVSEKTFCYLCHREGLNHIIGSADLEAHSAKKYEIIDQNNLIDDISVRCITCHDSTLGKEVNIGMGVWQHGYGGSHPIGVDFMQSYLKGDLVHPSQLDKNIRLFNGKIGCNTCHNKYSKEPSQLAISNKGSALCLACHIK